MPIVTHRNIFFAISALLCALSIGAIFMFNFQLGTDFTGGSILEVSYGNERPGLSLVQERVSALDIGTFSVRPSGERGYVLRSKELSLSEKEAVIGALRGDETQFSELRFNTVGPVAGTELKKKSAWALSIVVICILLFITFAFRKVSKPVASWKYGLATVVALLHDVLIPTGIYVALGNYFPLEIDLLFVSALLAILGYSVHDTIVVFDRVRERLMHNQEHNNHESFERVVGRSLVETLGRSINTSLTLIIVLVALLLLGSTSTFSFTLILLIGAIVGTYSSLCVAAPLLVTLAGKHSK